jgi:hypothetical protein
MYVCRILKKETYSKLTNIHPLYGDAHMQFRSNTATEVIMPLEQIYSLGI